LELLRRLGYDPVRLPGRAENYRLADGRTCRLRTTTTGSLATKTRARDGFAVDAPMLLESVEVALVVIAVRVGENRAEIYLTPRDRVTTDMRANHAHHLASNPNVRSRVRQIDFNGDPTQVGQGYRVHYAEFLLDTVDLVAVPASEPESELERARPNDELTSLMDRLARQAAADYGISPDRIRISIGVSFNSGELSFHWTPNAPE
jgi:hypothetical protein